MVQCWKSLHSERPIQLPDPIRNHQWRTETVQKASNLSWRTGVNDQPKGNTLCRYGMEDAWSIGDSNCRFIYWRWRSANNLSTDSTSISKEKVHLLQAGWYGMSQWSEVSTALSFWLGFPSSAVGGASGQTLGSEATMGEGVDPNHYRNHSIKRAHMVRQEGN